MIINASPQKFQEAVKKGFQRVKSYREARAMFIKEFVGQYFKAVKGLTSEEPINLLFTTIRTYVPNLVMRNPINKVTTEILQHKQYAELLGYGLDNLHRQIKLKEILRAWIVDAIFGLGIIETGLAASDNLVGIDDIDVDPGQIFSQIVDLDNFVLDPNCTNLDTAMFMGHLVLTPRAALHEISDLDTDLINNLPRAMSEGKGAKGDGVDKLSKPNINNHEMQDIEDYVEVVKVWVPEADAIVYMPDPRVSTSDDFIGVKQFYGPKSGPYSFLSLTPPVPNNPFPVAPVSIWYDLHAMANRVFKKMMDQIDAQKDIVFYRPALADIMEDVRTADNLECIATDDPGGIVKESFGGQNRDNVEAVGQIQGWFNYLAGNVDQIAGIQQKSKTATQAQIMQSNANVTLTDMQEIISDATGELSGKHAWYLHTDPLIRTPKTKRETGGEEVQLWLTPEQRQGDFLEYIFTIKKRSMGQMDPQMRINNVKEFAVNAVPAAAMAAQACLQMGIEFNLQRFLTNLADEMGINDFMVEVFNDPEFQQKMQLMAEMGPQDTGKASMLNPGAVRQNGGSPIQRTVQTPGQQQNSNSQQTAAGSQQANKLGGGY